MTVTSIAYAVFSIYVITATTVSLILKVLFLPFTAVASMASIFGGGSSVSPLEAGSSLPEGTSASMALETLLLQFSDFIQGVFAGQLVAGSVFTNFMLITILGFISMKMFISFSLYETKLVPTR